VERSFKKRHERENKRGMKNISHPSSKLGPARDEEKNLRRTLRVLVVDDNEDSAATLGMLLNTMRHDVRIAHDGLDAINVADEFRPNVILLDIGLPKLNGYETAESIRRKPWGKDVVIIATTGWGQVEAKERSKKAGFNYHMVKPVDLNALRSILASLEEGIVTSNQH